MDSLSKAQLERLNTEIVDTVKDLAIDKKSSELGELETLSMQEGFWDNQQSAKSIMSKIEALRKEIKTAEYLTTSINSLIELFDSVSEQERNSLTQDYESLQAEVDQFQTLKFLSGKYDKADAILSIHAGQGGTEANDWAEMLLRMYTRYAERNALVAEIQSIVPGTETGISTVTVIIKGLYAFGMLKMESGVHRLVRLSPYNAQSLRQTTFAGVEVIPVIEEEESEIVIPESDIEFKAVRSGGAGGQHVNKTSSAVQIRHIPTGITVHNSEQRMQAQNRAAAMKILKAKLWHIKETEKLDEISQIKGEHKTAGWGNQIRNYVLHPYKLVKDLRTNIESSNPEQVLDGDLQMFIDAEIRIR